MQAKGYPTKEPGWGSAEHKRHFLYVVFPNLSYDQKELGKFYLAAEGRAEIKELLAGKDFGLLNVPFKDPKFKLKKGVLIAAILRGDKTIVPTGDTCITEGDQVIITTSRKLKIRNLNDIKALS